MNNTSSTLKGKAAWWLLSICLGISLFTFEPLSKSRSVDALFILGILCGLFPILMTSNKKNISNYVWRILGMTFIATYIVFLVIGAQGK